MSLKEYSLKFTQLSKYGPTMVENSRAKMNKFVVGISNLVVNVCRLSMPIPSMDISHLMVHDEQIEKQKLQQVAMELKTSDPNEGNFSKAMFEI